MATYKQVNKAIELGSDGWELHKENKDRIGGPIKMQKNGTLVQILGDGTLEYTPYEESKKS